MQASEARYETKMSRDREMEKADISEILLLIKQATLKGNFYAVCDEAPTRGQTDKLIALGYKVEEVSYMRGPSKIFIKW